MTSEDALSQGLAEIDRLVDQGVSFSGHERNCAFLNVPDVTGSRRFATASAAMGLDFDDDARAPTLVDWDRDGDLDLWVSNRTAPMLRFVRNDSPKAGNWIALRLQGKTCNVDAIGARVELTLEGGRKLSQTLKAGEGYLAQSSKWLHFGLGSAEKITSVMVRWPDGKTDSFGGGERNRRFHAVQGEAQLKPDQAAAVILADAVSPEPVAETGAVRALSASRWPIPLLPYTTFDGQERAAGGDASSFTLVNLWATWCQPCIAELNAFASSQSDLSKADVKVLALSVDRLSVGGASSATSVDPATFYKKLGLPFEGGLATEDLVSHLETAYRMLFGPRWPLPVPTSVLLDKKGQLIAFYKGEVSPARVIEDIALSGRGDESLHDAALPFGGRWFRRPKPLGPLAFPLALMTEGKIDAAHEMANRAHDRLSDSSEYAKLRTWLGDALMAKDQVADALKSYTMAVEADATNVVVLNNLAWQLAAHPDKAVRDGLRAVQWAEKAALLTNQADPSVLDTLAAAYAESGDFQKATTTAEKAAALAKDSGDRALLEGILKGLSKYRAGKAFVEP